MKSKLLILITGTALIIFFIIVILFNKKDPDIKPETKKEYTNLFEGKYIFKVKAKNIYDMESNIATGKVRNVDEVNPTMAMKASRKRRRKRPRRKFPPNPPT